MTKIPKIIHYCWFGYGAKDDVIKKCMASWRHHLPEYQVKVWDELTFDINCNRFVAEAYANRKWAFVADYVRLHALYHEGGIYLDTDVEVFRALDEFLHHPAFSGFEDGQLIPTGIMGAEKGNSWIKRLLDYYSGRSFIQANSTMNLKPNTQIITEIACYEYGLRQDNSYQELQDAVTIYPREYFCLDTGIVEAYTTHHFNSSWLPYSRDYKQEAMRYKRMYVLLMDILTASDDRLLARFEALKLTGKNLAFFEFDFAHNILYQRLRHRNNINILGYISTGAPVGVDIPALSLQDIGSLGIEALIISTMWRVRDIKEQLAAYYPNVRVLSFEDVLDRYIMF